MARRRSLAVTGVALLTLALAGLAVPSTVAALTAVGHDDTLEAIRNGERPRDIDMRDAARVNDRAAALFSACRYETHALLALTTNGANPADTERRVSDSLSRCPASTYNWMRLAVARWALGNRDGARAAWRMSVLTGGYVPGLDIVRLEYGLRLADGGDAEHIELLGQQVRAVARENPGQAALSARTTGTVAVARAALRGEPTLDAFERSVAL
jgi:hypothetical protein